MRAGTRLTGKAFLATAAVAAAVGFTVYVLHSAWDLWGEMQWVARQIAAGEAFMAGLSGEPLDHWVGWAETQMETAARDGLRKILGTVELPNELKGLDLLECRIESNTVIFVWMGGIGGRTALEFRRTEGGLTRVFAWSEDEARELRRGP